MTSATTQLTRPYRSTESLSRWIVFCLIALIIGGIIVLLTYFNFIGSVNQVIKNPPTTFFQASRARIEILGKAQTFDNLYQLFIILSVPANLFINIMFMIWLYKSALNLIAFNVEGLRYTPGWAVGWFFISFANAVMPPIVLTEIWKASTPNGQADSKDWRGAPFSPVILLWWIFWLGMAFSPLILRFIPPPSQEQLSNGDFSLMTTRLTITGVLQICWAVSFIVLVNGITSRQMDKHIYVTAENRARNLPAKENLFPPGEEAPESRRITELQSPPPSELEQKVLIMVSERRTNSEIARILDLSPSQVQAVIDALYNKFDVNSDVDLAWKAREMGYLPG